MDELAVIISSHNGRWATWFRDTNGFLGLPPEAFRALQLPWGASPSYEYRRKQVQASRIVLSKTPRLMSLLYGIPVVTGSLFEANHDFGVIAEVAVEDGARALREDEFAVADAQTVIVVQHGADSSNSSRDGLHPDLLALDDRLTELTCYDGGDPGRRALLTLLRTSSNVLISGPKSVGKSYSLHALSKSSRVSYLFAQGPECMATFNLKKLARGAIPPYVVVLDNLDEIDMSKAKPYFDAIFSQATIISVIAIVTSLHAIPVFFRKRFSRTIEISAPSCEQRQSIVQDFFKDNRQSPLAEVVADSTPGYTRTGLNNLCLRAKTSAVMLDQTVAESHFRNLLGSRRKPSMKFAGYNDLVRRLSAIKNQWKQQESTSKEALVTGVLVHGPSGCGKTLLIQSVLSQDLCLNFVTLNAASIYSKYLGDSEARVRKIFLEAKQRKPCIVFIDDIDGISGSRSLNDDSDSGVKNRVLSTLLNELDGVSGRDGVYVVAATNRIDRMDSALLRPGRFDVHLYVGIPSYSDRLAISSEFLLSMKSDPDINVAELASIEMTGADIHCVCQRAGLLALSRKSDTHFVSAADFHMAIQEWSDSVHSN